jgi:hypothetical protein
MDGKLGDTANLSRKSTGVTFVGVSAKSKILYISEIVIKNENEIKDIKYIINNFSLLLFNH